MLKTLWYLYLILEVDRKGEHYYCGITFRLGDREKEHDKKRYTRKCPACNGTGKRREFDVIKEEWQVNECFMCHGNRRIAGNRKKIGRMRVIPIAGYRANSNEDTFGDYCKESLKDIYYWEKSTKKLSKSQKDEYYQRGLLAEYMERRIEEIKVNGELPEGYKRLLIKKPE